MYRNRLDPVNLKRGIVSEIQSDSIGGCLNFWVDRICSATNQLLSIIGPDAGKLNWSMQRNPTIQRDRITLQRSNLTESAPCFSWVGFHACPMFCIRSFIWTAAESVVESCQDACWIPGDCYILPCWIVTADWSLSSFKTVRILKYIEAVRPIDRLTDSASHLPISRSNPPEDFSLRFHLLIDLTCFILCGTVMGASSSWRLRSHREWSI